ncbi:MAG: hypothetical protein QOD75_2815 [Blastocatellia bacterium]|jgi:hypothetical protein|nr:hypothetical protein [Blastocatellia bacterium]
MDQKQIDREPLQQKIKNTPQRVFWSLYLSVLLGLLLGVRATILQVTAATFSVKTLFFTAMMVGFFAFNGLSLLGRSRWSYALLAVFALLPALGSLAGAIHLAALLASGEITSRPSDTIVSIVAVCQLVVIAALYFNLLSKVTRSYIWNAAAAKAAVD